MEFELRKTQKDTTIKGDQEPQTSEVRKEVTCLSLTVNIVFLSFGLLLSVVELYFLWNLYSVILHHKIFATKTTTAAAMKNIPENNKKNKKNLCEQLWKTSKGYYKGQLKVEQYQHTNGWEHFVDAHLHNIIAKHQLPAE